VRRSYWTKVLYGVCEVLAIGMSTVRAVADASEITGLLGGMRSWRWSGSRLR